MNMKQNKVYLTPASQLLDVDVEYVLCVSLNGERNDYGDPIEDEW
jgi:hypothetical protein